MILNIIEEKELPVYGDGKQIRDWIYVDDHNEAVWKILMKGKTGETYNIGGESEWENIKLLHKLIDIVSHKAQLNAESIKQHIKYVSDRPGHDRRYAIDCTKIKNKLRWKKRLSFEEGLLNTVDWYLKNTEWIQTVRSGEYRNWINKNYKNR